MPYIMGIDPGVQGGAVVLGYPKLTDGSGFPKLGESKFDFFCQLSFDEHEDRRFRDLETLLADFPCSLGHILIEKVSGYIGGLGQPGSRMFTFGESYASLKTVVRACMGWYPEQVTPQKWQGYLNLKKTKELKKKGKWKTFLLKKAEELFPTIKFSKQTSDAALIAYYGCLTQGER